MDEQSQGTRTGTREDQEAEGRRQLLKRVVISYQDLGEARASIRRLRELDEFDTPIGRRSHDFVAHCTCLVVAYARPFTKNGATRRTRSRLPDSLLADFSLEERRHHKAILRLRRQEFAHADAEVVQTEVEIVLQPYGPMAMPVSRVTRHGLMRHDVELVDEMIAKIMGRLHKHLTEIPKNLPMGDRF